MPSAEQPDPARGLFETLLVVDGKPVEMKAHLRRLTASSRTLYGEALPPKSADLLQRPCRGLALGRVRLTLAPGAEGLTCQVHTEPLEPSLHLPPWEEGADVRCHQLPGGLGEHKWADRSRLPTLSEQPLLLDLNHEVLEAGWANVFFALNGTVFTPPLDGRILPGITRASVIEIAGEEGIEVEERRIGREELLGADEVFLTSSIRGIQPVHSLDGTTIPRGEVFRLLGGRLARRYRTSWTLPAALSKSA
jgi:branched-subunit amino acid aminotransferase/4-amino-4-deoxychorismate lyase